MIQVKDFSVLVDGNPIVRDINFHLKTGELLAIIGPNGSGKTTLIKGLLGLLPNSGQIIYTGQKVDKLVARDVGYVPQRFHLPGILPLTVREFLNLYQQTALDWKLCGQLQIDRLMDRSLAVLSGGELQKVVLARALTRKPRVLVLDEASAGIDIPGKKKLAKLLLHFLKKHSVAVITITHDKEEVNYYRDNLNKSFYALELA